MAFLHYQGRGYKIPLLASQAERFDHKHNLIRIVAA